MNKIRIFLSMLSLLTMLAVKANAAPHWTCNPRDFQYDMTLLLDLQINDELMSNRGNYEIAAFCGDECRGVASVIHAGEGRSDYYSLRVRSNVAAEKITFKVYNKAEHKEYAANEVVDFESQKLMGLPSSPMALNVALSYQVSFMLDGVLFKTDSVKYKEKIVGPDVEDKEGYTFVGWENLPETMPAKDLVVHGKYQVNQYQCVYIIDGLPYDTVLVAYGDSIVLPAAPVKEGHTFSGWSEVPVVMPAHDVEVNGTFTVNTYTVVFKVDGEVYHSEQVEYGARINVPADPVQDGKKFSGWSEIPETMPAHDVEIVGTFDTNKYKLIFKVDGEIYKSDFVSYGDSIVLPAAPVKEGHTFSGWSEVPAVMPAHDVEVSGNFTVNKYQLVVKVDGEVYQQSEVAYGDSIVLPAAPVKEGHTFSGWSEVPVVMPAHDVAVNGSFTVNKYTIVFKVDGEVYQQSEVAYGDSIVLPAAPVKEGNTFSGWSEVPAVMPAHDVEVNGSFTVNTYTITYYLNEEFYGVQDVEYGAKIEPLVVEETDEVAFLGWENLPEIMPAHDLVIYGKTELTGIENLQLSEMVDVYTLQGKIIYKGLEWQFVKTSLRPGIYIVNGKKVFVK